MYKSDSTQNTVYDTSTILRKRLEEIFNVHISKLFEDNNDSSLNEIIATAKVLGGYDIEEQEGVIIAHFGMPKALRDFIDYLDENDLVDCYEIWAERKDGEKDIEGEVDFESLKDNDDTYNFRIFVYSNKEDDMYYYEDENNEKDEDEDEDEDEEGDDE